jgi:hypothetical protein
MTMSHRTGCSHELGNFVKARAACQSFLEWQSKSSFSADI